MSMGELSDQVVISVSGMCEVAGLALEIYLCFRF